MPLNSSSWKRCPALSNCTVTEWGKISRLHAHLTGIAPTFTTTFEFDSAQLDRRRLGEARTLIYSARIRIYGRVQGVWFRGWVVREAADCGLRGWVRNRTDGSVEALFAGAPSTVRKMIDACHGGPPDARVERIEEHPGTDQVPRGFEQLPTC